MSERLHPTAPPERPSRTRPSGAPLRELDSERIGERAGTPCNLIRKPAQLPPVKRVQGGQPGA